MLRLNKMKKEKDAHKAAVEKAKSEGKNIQNEHLDINDAAKLRLNKDLTELELPKFCRIENFPNTIMEFNLIVTPVEGIYKNATFPFNFKFDCNYPFEAPKIKCLKKIYHPNIDLQGNICLNILRDDWSPALNINSICLGICFLFTNFTANDPLNKEAAEMLSKNPGQFERNVERSLRGGNVGVEQYDKCYNDSGRYY